MRNFRQPTPEARQSARRPSLERWRMAIMDKVPAVSGGKAKNRAGYASRKKGLAEAAEAFVKVREGMAVIKFQLISRLKGKYLR